MHLDWEQGPHRTLRKYAQLGANAGDLAPDSMTYLWRPGEITPERLHGWTEQHGPVLVVVDSFAKAIAAAGIGEQAWGAHGAFVSMLNAYAVDRDCPVLLIDHKGRDSGNLASGAASKFDAARAQWSVKATRPFDADRLGEITLTCEKDSDSVLDSTVRYALGGDGPDRIDLRRVAKGAVPLQRLDRDIIEYLRSQQRSQSMSEIVAAVKGDDKAIRAAVKRLAADELSEVREVPGDRHPRYEVIS